MKYAANNDYIYLDDSNIADVPEKDEDEYDIDEDTYGLLNDDIESDFSEIPDEILKERKEENGKYDFFKVMADYESGNPKLRECAQLTMLDAMEGIIRSIIKKRYSTYATKHFRDLEAWGRYAVLAAMPRYDPSKATASTFFYPNIIHEMQKYIDSYVNKTSTHYSSNVRKIKKVINEFKASGKPYTSVDIAQVTNFTIEAVEQALSIIGYTEDIHYDNCSEGFLNRKANNTPEVDPEKAVEEKQTNETIYTAIKNNLSPKEQAIVAMSVGLGDTSPTSLKEISQTIGIPINKVKHMYNEALRKLRASKELKSVFCDHFSCEEDTIKDANFPFFNFDTPLNEPESLADVVEINF